MTNRHALQLAVTTACLDGPAGKEMGNGRDRVRERELEKDSVRELENAHLGGGRRVGGWWMVRFGMEGLVVRIVR